MGQFFNLLRDRHRAMLTIVSGSVLPFRTSGVTSARSTRTKGRVNIFGPPVLCQDNGRHPCLFSNRVKPRTLQRFKLLQFFRFVGQVSRRPFDPSNDIRNAIRCLVVNVTYEYYCQLSFETRNHRRMISVTLTGDRIGPVRRGPFPYVFFRSVNGNLSLASTFLITFLLMLRVNLRPIRRVGLVYVIRSANFTTNRFSGTFQLSNVHDNRYCFVLPANVIIHSQSGVRLRMLVYPLTVTMCVRVRAFTTVKRVLRPGASKLFCFFELLCS